MQLFLKPSDVWLFRDGRPFDALSDHGARTLFPPYPSVIQGVIRSHYLVIKNIDLRNKKEIAEVVGTAEDYKDLRLRGPFLARQEMGRVVRYLPQPADALMSEGDKLRPASPPRPIPNSAIANNVTPRLLGLDEEPGKGRSRLWVDEDSIHRYLEGGEVTGIPEEKLFWYESRFGIGRDDLRRTAREGALYEIEFVRLWEDVGLLVAVEGYDRWPERGFLRIGAEGRGAYFEEVKTSTWPTVPEPLPSCFRVYFATPAYFEGGWQPAAGNWSKFFDGPVELVAAAIHKYESIGGYDWATGTHKPARRYVPAGSVYYFVSSGQARLKPELIQRAITDRGAEIGFGQIIVKEWCQGV